MQKYDYLIIGGGIAGVTAAETIRERAPDSSIGLICDESYPLYSRVMLPGYLKKKISREQLFLRQVDDFTSKRIDLRLKEEAAYVDVKRKEVGLANRIVLSYEKLLIASGGNTLDWGRPEEQGFIYRLQTLDDADKLFQKLETIRQPIVIGASFISLEFLEIFVTNSIQPLLLVRTPHFFSRIFDYTGGEILHDNFERHGIKIQFNDEIAEITKHNTAFSVQTKGLRILESDALALGLGIKRNMEFIRGSGVELGEQGVRTNEYLETSITDVWAAGDVAEFYDVILGEHHAMGNWTNAFLQGQRVGLNMTGEREPFKKVSSYSITNLGFQITALGNCNDGRDTIVRVDKIKNQYERFFLRDGILVGAALINRFQDKSHLAKFIEAKVSMESYRDKLTDFGFDITAIPA